MVQHANLNSWRRILTARCHCRELDDDGFAESTPFFFIWPKAAAGSRMYERALMYQWLFFEQYTQPNIVVRRACIRSGRCDARTSGATLEGGNKALLVMESQLQKRPFYRHQIMCRHRFYAYARSQSADMNLRLSISGKMAEPCRATSATFRSHGCLECKGGMVRLCRVRQK